VSIGVTRWFGSERGATVETEESAVPRRGGGPHPLLRSGVTLYIWVCVSVYTRVNSHGRVLDKCFIYQVMSHMCSYICAVLRVLEYWRSPTKSVTCMTLPGENFSGLGDRDCFLKNRAARMLLRGWCCVGLL